MAAGMAMMREFEIYIGLERLMISLDEANNPLADRVRDLMDTLWLRLVPEEIARLDARGEIDPACLFPYTLPAPGPAVVSAATISGQSFETPGQAGWTAPAGWKRAA